MSDEQIVYISPEDDLTSVRERLGQITSKKVTLVVPNHAQLRSHVAWKLLYARARDLGKQVLIVSSDAQIRSVALAVNFKVANSLEAAASGQSKQASRPGRSASGRSRSSTGSPRSGTRGADARSGSLRSRQSSSSTDTPSRKQPPSVQHGPESRLSHDAVVPSTPPSTPGNLYGPVYGIDTTPPIQPLSPEQLDEEPDLLLEDFNRAQDIRQAALGSQPGARQERPPQQKMSPPARIHDDPFIFMDDSLPPPSMQEQRGSVPREPFATSEYDIQEIPDIPTEDIEDKSPHQGGPSSASPRSRSWVEPAPEDEQDVVGPSRALDVRPYRLGNTGKSPAASTGRREIRESHELVEGGEDDLPPIEDRPTRMTPQTPAPNVRRPSRPMEVAGSGSASSRRSQPLAPQGRTSKSLAPQGRISKSLAPRERSSRPLDLSARGQAPAQPSQQARQRSAASRAGTSPSRIGSAGTSRRSRAARASRRSTTITFTVIIILLLVVVAAAAYFGPAAEVSLTLQTKPYSHNLTIIAQNGNGAPGSVAAQLQTKTFSKNGTLIATGNKEVGTNAAQGTVTFKNNGKQRAIVPTNTVVATTSGIQFKTNAEASLGPSGQIGSTVPVPVTAVQVGDSGNVNAQTITTIPQESLNAIARYNNMNATALQLSVTNDNPTTGGGKGTKHTVQKSDLDNVRKDLHNQLQKDIDAWVNQWSSKGVHGNPSSTDQLVNAPAVDAIVNDINVPITLNVTTTLLYIPNDTLQQAAVTQLNTLMSKDNAYRGDHVLEQQGQPPVKLDQLKPPAGDAKSMTLTFKASTLASPKITQDDVRSRIVGQSVDSAVATLSKLPGVQHVEIKPWPDFITWVPTWTGRINVRFTRGTSTALAGAF